MTISKALFTNSNVYSLNITQNMMKIIEAGYMSSVCWLEVYTATMVHLFVVFDAHAERVDENGKENSTLKIFTVDQLLQLESHTAQITCNHATSIRSETGSQTLVINPLMGSLKPQSNCAHYTALQWLVHWPLMGGLLHLVQRWWAWSGCGPVQCPPRCTKCNSPPINSQCANFILFDVEL